VTSLVLYPLLKTIVKLLAFGFWLRWESILGFFPPFEIAKSKVHVSGLPYGGCFLVSQRPYLGQPIKYS